MISYRVGNDLDLDAVIEEIRRFSGREFDPAVSEAFFKACQSGDIVVGK